MDFRIFRRFIIPICALGALLWVFNRPFSAIALGAYELSGKFLYQGFDYLKSSLSTTKDLIKSKSKLEKLRRKNKLLKVANHELKSQLVELENYQKALKFQSSSPYNLVAAKIIGRSPDSWHQQIIINKGSHDGLKNNQGVITSNGIIGQIKKLSSHSAIIQLISNKDWRMGVKLPRINQYGVLTGNYPDPAIVQFITVDSDVQVGDDVVSSGICIDTSNCPYPENYPVGKVIEVDKDPNIIDLVVKIKFNENLSQIKEVFVLK